MRLSEKVAPGNLPEEQGNYCGLWKKIFIFLLPFAKPMFGIKKYLWTLICLPAMTWAQTDMDQGKILMIKVTEDIEVTGKGDHIAWEQADWVSLNPRKPVGEIYETRVKVMYSQKGIYFLFWCEDKVITATLQEDFADLYNEDVVEVFLWTDEDHPLYFEYELSPLNFELPIMVPNMEKSFFGWLPWHYEKERLTRHATHIEKKEGAVTAWTAEFFIPYTLLRPLNKVPPESGTTWRANMYRIDYDGQEPVHWTWNPVVNNFHDYKLFGTFKFE